ncbi:hypothetical protein CYMTET_53356 [Cymbomonas tetramitiformis]|uniref:t-SNARE coiled-coil homology domain-containing protein n=1 Tax=Cymbomonas tetramitiformis TaxID=36881 RepID=A0AAE0BIG5_9CHLO|nr:hypothetical protein CYMTET_53356 [Cymbomonas tetramitiformis]
MSWKHGHGNRDHLNNRSALFADPESGGLQMQMDPTEQLDSTVDVLRGKISMLKEVSAQIGDEVSIRNKLLTDLEGTMEKVSQTIKSSMKKMNKMYNDGSGNHMIFLVLFIFAVFILMYVWKKIYRLVT